MFYMGNGDAFTISGGVYATSEHGYQRYLFENPGGVALFECAMVTDTANYTAFTVQDRRLLTISLINEAPQYDNRTDTSNRSLNCGITTVRLSSWPPDCPNYCAKNSR